MRHRRNESAWELYDLSKDIGEKTDLAVKHPDILAKMKGFAVEAHRPMPKGKIYDPVVLQKDRNYFGEAAAPKAKKKQKRFLFWGAAA